MVPSSFAHIVQFAQFSTCILTQCVYGVIRDEVPASNLADHLSVSLLLLTNHK